MYASDSANASGAAPPAAVHPRAVQVDDGAWIGAQLRSLAGKEGLLPKDIPHSLGSAARQMYPSHNAEKGLVVIKRTEEHPDKFE